jgi:hypothetical protein
MSAAALGPDRASLSRTTVRILIAVERPRRPFIHISRQMDRAADPR